MSRGGPPPSTLLPPRPAPVWSRAPEPEAERVALLEAALSLPRVACRLLVVRGYADPDLAKHFLRPLLTGLCDPASMAGMTAAGSRIARALEREETILVHGDYDADGICGAALLTRWLRFLGGRVRPFIPGRIRDGYDFGEAGLEAAESAGATLVLTVDCGIRAHSAIEAAGQRGIDVVVTDHHAPDVTLPAATAVVNPQRADCDAGARSLSGTGVAYKLCEFLARLRRIPSEELHPHLDLVALATVADLVPLDGENRALVRFGLKALRRSRKPGIQALVRQTGLDAADVDSGRVGFVLAPRINAAGRVGDAGRALRLLLTEDPVEAAELAAGLEETNRLRREEDERILAEALELLADGYDGGRDLAVILESDRWHPGVIGIVASRVMERIHRPVVLVAFDGDVGRGSARSVDGFHLAEALASCGSHLIRFGGHARAAGMDVARSSLEDFKTAFMEEARRHLEGTVLRPSLEIDLELRLEEATAGLHRYLEYFGPFGIANRRPIFLARGVEAANPPRVVGSGHLKLDLVQDGHRIAAIGFGLAERVAPEEVANGEWDAVFQLGENRFRGRTTLQARLLDLRPAEEVDLRPAEDVDLRPAEDVDQRPAGNVPEGARPHGGS